MIRQAQERLPAGILRFGRYGIVGLSTNVAGYALFLAMIWLGMDPLLASGSCYVIGVVLSYLFNRRWTFASESSHTRDLPRFLLSYGLGLGVTLLAMAILLTFMRPEVAQLVTVGITAVSIYTFLHLFGFGRTT